MMMKQPNKIKIKLKINKNSLQIKSKILKTVLNNWMETLIIIKPNNNNHNNKSSNNNKWIKIKIRI